MNRRRSAFAVIFAAFALAEGNASAEPTSNPARLESQSASPPRTPAPFILPNLAHSKLDVGVDWFLGSLATNPGTLRSDTPASMFRLAGEVNVLPRRLYLGVAYPIGFALPPDGGLAAGEVGRAAGSRALAGNIEAHIRAVFPMPTWLEIGFVMDVMAPTATFNRDTRGNVSAVAAIASLDPGSYLDFLPGRVALRPAGDLRIRRGQAIFQGRHGMDIIIDDNGVESVMLAGRLLARVGYVIDDSLEVSVEAQQYYFFTGNPQITAITTPAAAFAETYRIKDGSRSALTFGPALRASTTNFDYGLALLTNIADPVSPVVDRMLGLRFSVIAHIPTHKD